MARVAEFVAGEEHGCSTAAHEHGTGVLDHAEAQRQNVRIVRFAFRAAVPAVVVIEAVGIVPAVGFIVLYIIAVQVVQGESVVAGQEIDGCVAAPVNRVIKVRRSGHPLGCDPGHLQISLQEAAHVVPVAAVPFRPSFPGRE